MKGGGALLLTAASCDLNYNAVRKPSGPATSRMVNHLRLGEELLNMKDPPIRALYVSANNPAVTCPEAHKVRKGLAREDLFTVVHDPFMTDTAKYADIVLPAASYLETDDLYRAYGAYWMQWGRQAAKPRGEARSNFDVAQALATAHGPRPTRSSPCRRRTRRRSCSRARPVRPRRPSPRSCSPASRSTSSTTGTGQPFGTPSGKLEFFSEQLAEHGPLARARLEPRSDRSGRRRPSGRCAC